MDPPRLRMQVIKADPDIQPRTIAGSSRQPSARAAVRTVSTQCGAIPASEYQTLRSMIQSPGKTAERLTPCVRAGRRRQVSKSANGERLAGGCDRMRG